MKIGWLVPKIQAVEGFSKLEKTNEMFPFNLLYLKISICEFRLILRDHVLHTVKLKAFKDSFGLITGATNPIQGTFKTNYYRYEKTLAQCSTMKLAQSITMDSKGQIYFYDFKLPETSISNLKTLCL